jgi:multisubunit Na+/H+ antiporter MnhB subunit
LIGGLVVLLGLVAVVVALALVLDHYPVERATRAATGSDRSSAVVAVMAPVVASILGLVGLYFGVSATQTRTAEAEARAEEVKGAATAARVAGGMSPEQFATLTNPR